MIAKDYNKVKPDILARLRNMELTMVGFGKDIARLNETVCNHLTTAVNELTKQVAEVVPVVRLIQKCVIGTVITALASGAVAAVWYVVEHWRHGG